MTGEMRVWPVKSTIRHCPLTGRYFEPNLRSGDFFFFFGGEKKKNRLIADYFEPWRRARVWSTKPGKISKIRNKQTSDQEHEINCTVPERKEIRAVCLLTPRLFSHSKLSSRLGRYKGSHFFLFCLWEFIFSSRESKRCWTVHRDERIN